MSLSERLRAAERARHGLVETESSPTDDEHIAPVIDLRPGADPVIDLTEPLPAWTTHAAPAPSTGIRFDPVRDGDASRAFAEFRPVALDRSSGHLCPKCGGPTQIDLLDQVHQSVSLSCTSCFHMFRLGT